MTSKILFLTTLYNNASSIEATLRSIIKQRGNFHISILVINDGSTDSSLNLVKKYTCKYHRIKLITVPHNGQSAALNTGLKLTRNFDFVALVEADVVIEPRWLFKNLKLFKKKQIAGIGGHLLPFPNDSWISRIVGLEVEYKIEHQFFPIRHLSSANVIYRRQIFTQIKPFKTNLKNAAFDAEFNQRLLRANFQLVYNSKAIAYHHYKSSLWQFLKRVYAYSFYRLNLTPKNLYPYDRVIQLQIILNLFLILFLPIVIYLFDHSLIVASYLLLIIIYLFSTLPLIIWIIKKHKDYVILLYPITNFLRNLVAIIGLTLSAARCSKIYVQRR